MATRTMIDEFLTNHRLALVRSSPSSPIRGAKIDEELSGKGYEVAVVYLDESVTESKLADLAGQVEGVIVAVSRDQCEQAVREAVEAKIPRIWVQSGCESESAIALCECEGIPVVYGECVLMYAEPVNSVHAFHRWLWKALRLYAK